MNRKLRRGKYGKLSRISMYLPICIIILSIAFIVGSTLAYFTNKVSKESTLTFGKVELGAETNVGFNGTIYDVVPGTPLINGKLQFSKSIDSEAIYVRAKLSFSLVDEYKEDVTMQEFIDVIRSSTEFDVVSTAQHGAVWSAKQGNYFYLLDASDNTKLMRVDTIDTFVLSNEIVVPRDLDQLDENYQYMKSINFHIAFEAIQADNVSNILTDTKETFNALFPESSDESYTPPYHGLTITSDSINYGVGNKNVKVNTRVYTSQVRASDALELEEYAKTFVNSTPSTLDVNKPVTQITGYDYSYNYTTNSSLVDNGVYNAQSSKNVEDFSAELGSNGIGSIYFVVEVENCQNSVLYTKVTK